LNSYEKFFNTKVIIATKIRPVRFELFHTDGKADEGRS